MNLQNVTKCFLLIDSSSLWITTVFWTEVDLGLLQHPTSKMGRFVIIVNGFQLLTIITKCSILDVATVLDPPLNVIARSRFEDILLNLHFLNNTKDDKSDKDYKVRFLINHFNQSFSDSVSNDDSQSIDKHLIEFRDQSSMKQYVKTNQSNGVSSFGIVVLVKQDTSINYTCTWVKKAQKKI